MAALATRNRRTVKDSTDLLTITLLVCLTFEQKWRINSPLQSGCFSPSERKRKLLSRISPQPQVDLVAVITKAWRCKEGNHGELKSRRLWLFKHFCSILFHSLGGEGTFHPCHVMQEKCLLSRLLHAYRSHNIKQQRVMTRYNYTTVTCNNSIQQHRHFLNSR